MVVAAPAYLERKGTPHSPQDLAEHNCLSFNLRQSLDEWPFTTVVGGEHVIRHAISGDMRVDNGETMRQMALASVGIARLSGFHVGRDVAEGRLVRILEDFNPGDTEPIHAVYVAHDYVASRVRAFIDFLVENMPKTPSVA
jgi:DNA-binding transcriptional LysR family regulator